MCAPYKSLNMLLKKRILQKSWSDRLSLNILYKEICVLAYLPFIAHRLTREPVKLLSCNTACLFVKNFNSLSSLRLNTWTEYIQWKLAGTTNWLFDSLEIQIHGIFLQNQSTCTIFRIWTGNPFPVAAMQSISNIAQIYPTFHLYFCI